jgi:membrane protease YdiL (CAAX protease family)
MLLAGWRLGAFASRGPLRPRALAAGLASAAALYLVFLAGNAGVTALHPFGVGAASEQSIYSLIASPSNPIALQAAVLLFDSAGYEGFFRGALMSRAEPRLGAWAPAGVAAADACMHLATLNPLWVATTFVADLCWGETCRRGGGLQASFVSHLAWDLLIFVVAPIR